MEDKQDKQKKSIGIKLFIIFLIGIMLLFTKQENQEKFIGFINKDKTPKGTLKVIGSIPITPGITEIGSYEKSIIIWQNDKLGKFKVDGSNEWEKAFSFDQPMLRFGKNNIYVCEKTTGDIYVLDSQGESLNRIELNTKIFNLKEEKENILVHSKNIDTDVESIKILDKNGHILDETLVEGGSILTYSINEDEDTYAISTLELSEEKLKTKVETFKIGGELLYTSFFDNEVVLFSTFIDKGKLLTMSDNSICLIDRENKLWDKKLQLIKDIYVDKNKINILYGNTLESLSSDGETDKKYSLTEEYNKIVPYDKYLVLYGDENIIGLKNGEEIFKYNSEEIILNVLESKQNLIIIYENKIDILSL